MADDDDRPVDSSTTTCWSVWVQNVHEQAASRRVSEYTSSWRRQSHTLPAFVFLVTPLPPLTQLLLCAATDSAAAAAAAAASAPCWRPQRWLTSSSRVDRSIARATVSLQPPQPTPQHCERCASAAGRARSANSPAELPLSACNRSLVATIRTLHIRREHYHSASSSFINPRGVDPPILWSCSVSVVRWLFCPDANVKIL